MPVTVQALVEAARIRHWSFTDCELGDGALLAFLNQRQRTHLAQYGAQIEGLVGTSMSYTLGVNTGQAVVALTGGIPTYGTTYQDGWPIHSVGGVPYIDVTEPALARDPFGASGGTPGFPLPGDMVRLINVGLVYTFGNAGQNIPCDIIPERERHTWLPGRNPACFVSGNRLVPVFSLAGAGQNTNDRWYNVASIQISYVAIQTLAALTDTLAMPAVLCEALTADLAVLMAGQSKECTPADRAFHLGEAQRCAQAVAASSLDLIESVQQSTVFYRR